MNYHTEYAHCKQSYVIHVPITFIIVDYTEIIYTLALNSNVRISIGLMVTVNFGLRIGSPIEDGLGNPVGTVMRWCVYVHVSMLVL